MPLTPPDVAAKQFRVAFRGYDRDEVDAFLEEVESELGRLLSSGGGQQSAPSVVPPAAAGREGQEAALRTLLLAQRTADDAMAEAQAEAEQVRTAARTEAEATLAAARSEVEAALGDLEARRQRLEARIEELRAFEREYRTRLRAYLQGQLRELDSQSGPDDIGAGVPVGAGRAAVDRKTAPGATKGARPDPIRTDH